jgi:uncharacterized protein (TIGR02246 family)
MMPEEFSRSFAAAFAAQDAAAIANLLATEGMFLTLTGIAAETREDARHAMAQEFTGIFIQSRLVTGKGAVQSLSPDTALVTQRYVVTGAVDENGADLPRFAALLVAVLHNNNGAWQAISLTFNAVA